MSAEDKSTKKDSKIISDMKKILEKEPVFDKWYDELITEIEETDKEYEKSVSHYKEVMKDSDKVLKLTEEKLKDDGKKKKSTSFNADNIKVWIEEALVRKGIITNEKSYSHKPHLASLPYDHKTNDPDKLQERKEELEKRISEEEEKIRQLQKKNDELEKQIYGDLEYNLNSSDEKLEDYTDEMDATLEDTVERLDYRIDEVLYSEGTLYDTRDVWYDLGFGEQFDKLQTDMSKLYGNIGELKDDIRNSYQNNLSLDKYDKTLDELIKNSQSIYDYLSNIYNSNDDGATLVNGANPTVKRVMDNLTDVKKLITNYSTEKENNNKINKEINDIQSEVDGNNLEIGKIDNIITDYTTELDRTNTHIDKVTQ